MAVCKISMRHITKDVEEDAFVQSQVKKIRKEGDTIAVYRKIGGAEER